ncbi:MAG TPA: type II secretion system F family protein [Acidimicrobiales bacterium]|nr:type II secretion system F family protein [Acidimicrobiales bacterium]
MTAAPGPHAAGVAALACGSLVTALAASIRLALITGRRGSVVQRLPGRGRESAIRPSDRAAAGEASADFGSGPRWLPAALVAADVGIDAATAWKLWCGGVVVSVTVLSVMAGPALAVAALIAGVAGPAVALRSRRGRGDARVEAALPGALEAVARALRTGASLRQAVGEAAERTPGPLGHELGRVSTQTDRGAPLVAALEDLAQRRPLPGVRLAVAALCLGAETGGAQARSVDGVAATLRDRLGLLAEVRALSSQARISALVISLAPLGFGAFAAATDPRTSTFLFHTAAGFVLLAAGGLLDGLGWAWMNRLSRVTL